MEPDDIADLFAAFGPVTVRRMFGGQGIYADGLMFALQAGGIVYLKADAAFSEHLAARGSQPFSYDTVKGRHTITSYWQVPEAAMDDGEDLAVLARQALAIARAADVVKSRKQVCKRGMRKGRASVGAALPVEETVAPHEAPLDAALPAPRRRRRPSGG